MKDEANSKLFDKMPAEIKRLNKQARREKRLIEREKYAEDNGIEPVVRE